MDCVGTMTEKQITREVKSETSVSCISFYHCGDHCISFHTAEGDSAAFQKYF